LLTLLFCSILFHSVCVCEQWWNREEPSSDLCLEEAAILIEDALHFKPHNYLNDKRSLRVYKFQESTLWLTVIWWFTVYAHAHNEYQFYHYNPLICIHVLGCIYQIRYSACVLFLLLGFNDAPWKHRQEDPIQVSTHTKKHTYIYKTLSLMGGLHTSLHMISNFI
jgi:hypothetical protein